MSASDPASAPPAKGAQPEITIASLFRRLRPYLTRYPFLIALILLALFLDAAFNAALPVSFKYIIDYALVGPDMAVDVRTPAEHTELVRILIALACGVLVIALTGVGRHYLTHAMLANVIRDIRMSLFDHLQRLSMAFFSRRQMGDLLARFSGDMVSVETTLLATSAWVLLPSMNVLMGTAVLFTLDWRLALVSLLVWPFSLFIPNLFAAPATRASYAKKQDEAQALSALQENLDARTVIRAFGLQSWSREIFRRRNARLGASTRRYGFLSALIEHSALMGIIVLQIVVLGVGAWMAWKEEITIGGLAAFQTIFLAMSTNLGYVTQFVPNLIQAAGSMERIEEIIRETPDVADAVDARPLAGFTSGIELRNVTFGYAPGARNLDDVSLVIRRGERVAFVGGSGSGKSTILSLVMRFYDPQEGTVTVDGADVRSVTQESLRALMGVVFQENFLFNLSIRENLRLGRPGATDAEVEAAARAAEIHATILEMPQGYDTPTGERGGQLSGGQRQRLAIARALLNDPKVLILDEATSALDPVTEEAINATLEKVGKDRTVLMVSHRLAAVRNMDRIVVLDHGRIREQGRHEELIAKNGLYAELWRKQGGFALPDDQAEATVTPERLRAYPLFARLPEPELARLADLLITRRRPAGVPVVSEGESARYFHIMVRGKAKAVRAGTEVARFGEGDCFGENALLHDAPADVTITTLEPSVFLTLEHPLFARLIRENPGFRAELERFLQGRFQGEKRDARG